jgi:adenylosuccinate synthase
MVDHKIYIVVGLGFGDEGKGLTTDFFCLQHPNSIVIRFNGGHQAGHCVVTGDGRSHIFSNFGSGSLRGIPTFWSSYCTVAPAFLVEEWGMLAQEPTLYIDLKCPITTHYDVLFNRCLEITLGDGRKGSCGVGFGATVDREADGLSFTFGDLLLEETVKQKLKGIRKYYRKMVNLETGFDFDELDHGFEDEQFFFSLLQIRKKIAQGAIVPVNEADFFKMMVSKTLIFEGAQGVMLDKDFGVSPHVTKSHTTSLNAMALLRRNHITSKPVIVYVSRCYQTRHGAGPFPEKHPAFSLHSQNVSETNKTNTYQGDFKANFLNIDDLNTALTYDGEIAKGLEKRLMLTCLDHFPDYMMWVIKSGKLTNIRYDEIPSMLSCTFTKTYFSFSNCAENLISDSGH